ncbi:MAG TPA: hypothetical protein DEP18_08930 [Flavobacteriales bacterium]|nr:hypothetical protein [Flavobacteriales bacterium]HCA83900.1 hypothetical protein [Flavobacteriales bacterium]HRE73943.1 hypothetical protein [Flavobacteriales bacterium]HRE98267.1 hypothetical protein [Flavobacteriales bacterium]HRJ35212.1 hypothetical protein [Flavobacteriales bacterium]
MRTIALFILFLFAGILAQAQKSDWDQRLESAYTVKELTEMKKSDPSKLAFLNAVATKGWVIMDLPSEKGSATEIRGSITVPDQKNVNLFALNLFPEKTNWQYYRISGTDKMLVVYSEDHIRSQMNK